ncbi:MAG: hypothetical protein EPO24_14150 [Bacteroidetes bacterium]|nr:MAG: hypothetical protein EPO24_14150 [Bacteroidota bacterium]
MPLLGTQSIYGQEADSLEKQEELTEASRNRLFWMSTGKISAPHRVSIGLFSFLVLQGGYSPTDFLQLNTSLTFGYWSLGSKFQLMQETEFIRGISVGADIGFSPQSESFVVTRDQLTAFTVSGSFGNENAQLHLASFMVVQPNKTWENTLPPSFQIGFDIQLDRDSNRQAKLMAESWWVYEPSLKKYDAAIIMIGGRSYGRTFILDVAAMIGPTLCFGHCSSASGLRLFPLPYINLMWFI